MMTMMMMMIYLGILMPTDWTPAMTWPVVMPARTLSRSYGRCDTTNLHNHRIFAAEGPRC